jgi:hypothetical protein
MAVLVDCSHTPEQTQYPISVASLYYLGFTRFYNLFYDELRGLTMHLRIYLIIRKFGQATAINKYPHYQQTTYASIKYQVPFQRQSIFMGATLNFAK